MAQDETITFSVSKNKKTSIKEILSTVYSALLEKGYNPENQIVGYIISQDPTYITQYKNARNLIMKLDRDEILKILLKYYLFQK
ncbi:MAG: IreB family regulatory phosphoprotein [Candidatus Paraimprobicoccus trichonymphae]|uniref:IreB family regulatory phosphoprotein n=1 Tax=Candidatus Paraimprobicoccus trichonymphae TaxID=3033793 RepID=A0AA48L1E3_9FIRM|nr:MAG: IreB family regulatory phosphoprotein [Candidatus Paraimprobicoccus trichonymphae]